MSIFADYRRGMETLLQQLEVKFGRDPDGIYGEAVVYQSRLEDNLYAAERYGDTEARRADRTQVLDALNRLALRHLGASFNALYRAQPDAGSGTASQITTTTTASGERGMAIGGNVSGSALITGNGNVVGDGNVIIQGEAMPTGDAEGLHGALRMARRALAILEEQAAGYSALSIPVHLQIELEEQRKRVRDLEVRLQAAAR